MNKEKENKPRKGCRDVFNAFMLKGAKFVGKEDIPFCPTTAKEVPSKLVAYDITKNLINKKGFVHFYLDDQKFDGKSGIWHESKKALERLKGFDGIITPDFSTNQDFPAPIKKYNTYRMRSFGYWAGKNGLQVINNVRWGTSETYDYCFSGIPQNSIVAISTNGCIQEKKNWHRFEDGLAEMVKRLSPHTIVVYGSTPDKFFKKYKDMGINIISFPSEVRDYYDRRKKDEQTR